MYFPSSNSPIVFVAYSTDPIRHGLAALSLHELAHHSLTGPHVFRKAAKSIAGASIVSATLTNDSLARQNVPRPTEIQTQ